MERLDMTPTEEPGSTSALERARAAYGRKAWREAFDLLTLADAAVPLLSADLERLAIAAYLIGRADDTIVANERLHRVALERGDTTTAARCAFWLALHFLDRGEPARGAGWLARGERLLDEQDLDCVERGYLLLPGALRSQSDGDQTDAYDAYSKVAAIAERFGDGDLETLARLGQGETLLAMGEMARGAALFDEAMVSVGAGEVSPIVIGIAYCSAIETCYRMFDLRRASEWTAALSRWCDSQPDLVPYRGQCRIYRAELLRFHGAWGDAAAEARLAQEWLSRPPATDPAIGEAWYQQAELHRLRGVFDQAEAAYREASTHGRRPQPGLALLRLAQGQVAAARAAAARALAETDDRATRSRLLDAFVEIALAAGDVAGARAAADELTSLASGFEAPMVAAMAGRADGSVRLAEGDASAALGVLRRARSTWQAIDAPYEAARTRVVIAAACRALGDEEAAEMELAVASRVFRDLGAGPDAARAGSVGESVAGVGARLAGLTPREVEVLKLVATGRTNREVAADLVLSEKTVARHLSNIFAKLGVSSRAAATAWAYEHGLVPSR